MSMIGKATRGLLTAGAEGVFSLARRVDGWVNFATGLGDPHRDKRMHSKPTLELLLDDITLENMFTGNDIVRRICKTLPDRALKQGYKWVSQAHGIDPDQAQDDSLKLHRACEKWGLRGKCVEAGTWGRLYGKGCILIGALGSGLPNEPLIDEQAKKLLYLTVLDRRDLLPRQYYDDPTDVKFGEVKTWLLQPVGLPVGQGFPVVEIHESRLVNFPGVLTSKRQKVYHFGADHSAMQAIYAVLRDFTQAYDGVSHLMTDASQGVFKIKDLMRLLTTDQGQVLRDRMEMTDYVRSVARAILLDADMESFERVTAELSGYPAVMDKLCERMSSAAEMPLTVLFGRAPAGMNATGESDTRIFYDSVIEYQGTHTGPGIERIGRIIARTEGLVSNSEEWHVQFPTPWKRNAEEEAAHIGAVSTADVAYINAGVWLPEEVALARSNRPDPWDNPVVIDLDARRKSLKVSLDQLKQGPPPAPLMDPNAPNPKGLPAPKKQGALPPKPEPEDADKTPQERD